VLQINKRPSAVCRREYRVNSTTLQTPHFAIC
jgi:hypothetical protein